MDRLRIFERLQGVGMDEAVAKELASIIGHDSNRAATKADTAYLGNARKADTVHIEELVDRSSEGVDRLCEKIDRLSEKVDRLGEKIARKMDFMIAVSILGFIVLGVLSVYSAFVR